MSITKLLTSNAFGDSSIATSCRWQPRRLALVVVREGVKKPIKKVVRVFLVFPSLNLVRVIPLERRL